VRNENRVARFAYLKRYPWMAAGTLTCAILSTVMVIVFPAATKWIIDDVLGANRPDKLLPLILLAAVAFLLQYGFNALRIAPNNTFEQKVIFDLHRDFELLDMNPVGKRIGFVGHLARLPGC
jgi:ABC-type bacteriocin/lantibiotic exporter with double-glycine peptidase domain